MAKQLQIRGGTTAQHATFVGAGRELTVDTTKQTVVVHDGSTAGGFPLARESVVTALNNRLILVDNTADSTKNVLSATKLTTARTIAMTGDIAWSTSFDGSGNVTSVGTLANSGVTAGTYRSVTTDAKGRVTAGTNPTTIAGYGITDAYNKTEIDTFIQGFKPKTEVKLATTANITLSGAQTIDGISAIVGDRVLVKNQTTQSENGIYVVSATSWTRATDSDSALELTGSYCFVSQGSTQSDTGWYMNSDSVVLGTTAIVWIQFTGTGAYAPISHVGTNGTSHAAVTQSVNGFMLSTDKLKLDSATNINTVNTIVMRDSSGNFTAGLITGTSFNSITGLSSTTPLANGTAAIGTSTTTARADHVHPVQTTITGSAGSVVASEIIKFDTGTTEGTDLYTFNGSTAKTIDIKAGTNVTLNKTAGSVTIDVSESNLMTKSEFNALAEEIKANRAGSGFYEFGKHSVGYSSVNDGIICALGADYTNAFQFGWNYASQLAGVSKTNYPIANVNGIVHKLHSIARNSTSYEINKIILPTAPTIYPSTTTLTAEQIASGVIKHADSSNSGLIVNGKFDTDTSGWTALSCTLSVEAGKLKIVNNGGINGSAQQSFSTIIGKKYIIELELTSGNYNMGMQVKGDAAGISGWSIAGSPTGRYTYEYIATSTTSYILFSPYNNSAGAYGYVDNISVYPADAISRSDLVFLESWHEDISEKNFVYPLGNVQYLGADTDGLTGIANGAFTGFGTYSLFGKWQASSALIGKGYVWSSLSASQKKAFVSNPENNCYLDDNKVIQVRYRVRVVQGLGDTWNSVSAISGMSLNYSPSGVAYPKPNGKLVSIPLDIQNANTEGNTGYFSAYNNMNMINTGNIGAFSAVTKTNTLDTTVAYEGKCYALPIALVHRRNQGAYHPVYNPNGTSGRWYSDGSVLPWYSSLISMVASISDCFNFASADAVQIGKVPYGIYGAFILSTPNCVKRPDGLFYDQVHESDIIDLRNSSKKVEDYNRLINREFNKLVAGTYRGKEGEWNELSSGDYTTTGNSYLSRLGASSTRIDYTGNPASLLTNSTLFADAGRIGTYIKGSNGNYYRVIEINISSSNNMAVYLGHEHGDVRSVFPVGTYNLVISDNTTRTKSNTLLHCDIIGNPTNYPTAWKQSGVSGTPLLIAEDGTSSLPDGAKDTFKLSRKANTTPLLCLRSTDSGATWTSFTPTFNTTTNEITLTNEPSANLVMVYYQTHTSMAVPTVNSEVLEIGDVWATNMQYGGYPAFIQTLIGKVLTNQIKPLLDIIRGFDHLDINVSSSKFDVDSALPSHKPSHRTIDLYATSTPACKVFPYLTRTNGKAYLNLVFKEMKYNGTTWGDHDNTFNIVDNVSTTTDGNGQTILIGQKTVELPYFIGLEE